MWLKPAPGLKNIFSKMCIIFADCVVVLPRFYIKES